MIHCWKSFTKTSRNVTLPTWPQDATFWRSEWTGRRSFDMSKLYPFENSVRKLYEVRWEVAICDRVTSNVTRRERTPRNVFFHSRHGTHNCLEIVVLSQNRDVAISEKLLEIHYFSPEFSALEYCLVTTFINRNDNGRRRWRNTIK